MDTLDIFGGLINGFPEMESVIETGFLKFSRYLCFLNEIENVSINRISLSYLIMTINWEKMEIQLSSKDCTFFHLS